MGRTLIIGACGQIGRELTQVLCQRHGYDAVIASDIQPNWVRADEILFIQLDVQNKSLLENLVRKYEVEVIYHLAAYLSGSAERYPSKAWHLNTMGLLNVLEVACTCGVKQVFFPSSIAVFGVGAAKNDTPQDSILDPSSVYGISKSAGEQLCQYYHRNYGLDVRSLRYPGLLSPEPLSGAGTTDYAVEMFEASAKKQPYTCFLAPNMTLPMMYIEDAIQGTIALMSVPEDQISVRLGYNFTALSFSPADLEVQLQQYDPAFSVQYTTDFRNAIAATWPNSIDDSVARRDWGWCPKYNIARLTKVMRSAVEQNIPQTPSL